MKFKKFLIVLAALVVLVGVAGYHALVPAEADRPPPANVAEPNLVPVPAPFTHRWNKETSHPLLASAASDIDGNGRDEVFLGGSDGQPDALLAWRDGRLVDIAAETGIGDDPATYGALSIDLDGDGRVDLMTVGHGGIVFWMNKGGRFERRPLDVKLPDGGVPMAVTAGDFDRDGHVDLYVSVFVEPVRRFSTTRRMRNGTCCCAVSAISSLRMSRTRSPPDCKTPSPRLSSTWTATAG